MPTNPFIDIWHFLTANTNDYLHQGSWRYLILALFWALMLAAIAMAVRNWQQDPTQRTGRHLGVWVVRVLIGCMWACEGRRCCRRVRALRMFLTPKPTSVAH